MKIKGTTLHKSLSLIMSPRLAKKHLEIAVAMHEQEGEFVDLENCKLVRALYWDLTPQEYEWWYKRELKIIKIFGMEYGGRY